MTNYFIYAADYSASTNNVEYYHSNALNTLKKFQEDVKKIEEDLLKAGEPIAKSEIVYLHWGNKCVKVDEAKVRDTYNARCGDFWDTRPETIIAYLKGNGDFHENHKIKLVYIITDGLISNHSAEKCFKDNEDMHYERIVFHAFNDELNSINLSVASSFFKSHCMVYCNNELNDCIDISKEFDYSKVNIQNFAEEKSQLMSYIKLKFINKYKKDANALKEIDKLKKLRERLFDELSKETTNTVYLDTKDKKSFLSEFAKTNWYLTLYSPFYANKLDFEKSISTLINYIVSDAKSYSFDALKFDMKYDKAVGNEELVDVEFTPEQEIKFPDIIMDDEKGIPVVILTTLDLMDKIIFHGHDRTKQVLPASFSKFKSIIECPLFLMNDPDLSDSIGYFYTLNVYRQLLENNMKTEPRTRRPFHGGLVLTDTEHFDRYNDYILSATYFDCKKVKYNIGLFYFVLWKNCEKKEWMDTNVVEQFKKYAMRRISETTCKIGLSSLPLDPDESTKLPTALWYCVELSSNIFKNDPQHFKHERLRGYHSVAHYMIEILKHFEYDLDLESIEKRIELFSYVMTLKRIQKRTDKVYYMLQKIFKTVEGFLVSEIVNPSDLYKLNYLELNHKGILPDNVVEEKVHLNEYVHLMHFSGNSEASKPGKDTFDICEKTFRPFFAIDNNKSFYTELVNNSKKVVIINDDDKDEIKVAYEAVDSLKFDRILSLYKLFIDCVEDSEKYPTLTEYVEYVSKRKKFHGELVTIFALNVGFGVSDVYERYQKVIENVPVEEFVRVCKSCVKRTERIKTEERVKFNNDNEIDEFISREESKVKLKKKS